MSRLSSTDAPATEADGAAGEDGLPQTDEGRDSLVDALRVEFGDALVGSHVDPGLDVWVRVERAVWADTAAYLRDGMGFAYFNFLSAIDWMPSPFGRDMDSQVDLSLEEEGEGEGGSPGSADPADAGAGMEQGVAGGDTRFQVFARLNDIVNHRAITLKTDVPDDDLSVPSWVSVYAGANWHEREAWEMFGIDFADHPGLRNIYLPGDFEGHPLRKDYPLLARRVKPWPGIVDVEAMPGDDDEAGPESDAAADPAAGGYAPEDSDSSAAGPATAGEDPA